MDKLNRNKINLCELNITISDEHSEINDIMRLYYIDLLVENGSISEQEGEVLEANYKEYVTCLKYFHDTSDYYDTSPLSDNIYTDGRIFNRRELVKDRVFELQSELEQYGVLDIKFDLVKSVDMYTRVKGRTFAR